LRKSAWVLEREPWFYIPFSFLQYHAPWGTEPHVAFLVSTYKSICSTFLIIRAPIVLGCKMQFLDTSSHHVFTLYNAHVLGPVLPKLLIKTIWVKANSQLRKQHAVFSLVKCCPISKQDISAFLGFRGQYYQPSTAVSTQSCLPLGLGTKGHTSNITEVIQN